MKKEIKIIIADDHPIFRSGLKQAIENVEHFNVIADASNGEEALFKIQALRPDIAIIDLDLPRLNGFQVAKELNSLNHSTKVIFLTMHNGDDFLQEAIKLNVKGYILKESPMHEVLAAIDKVFSGEKYISSEITETVITKNLFNINQENSTKKLLLQKLTQSELNILKLIAAQKTSKQIAEELFITYKTVEKHRSNICDKLKLSGNNALLKFVIEYREFI